MPQTQINAYLASKARVEKDVTFPKNFRELLTNAAKNYGDKPAVNFFEQGTGVSLSFSTLASKVNQLADGLSQQGVVKGSHVAVMLSNRVEYPITWLALATLGAVMIPVNTRYTAKELDYLINDSDTEFVVTEASFLAVLSQMQECPAHITPDRHFVIDDVSRDYSDWQMILNSGRVDFVPDWAVDSNDLLNIQYTSGTTGFPKGCMQTQKYWILLGCVVDEMIPDRINNILTDHSFFYMDPQWQLVMALYCGARLNVAARLSASEFLPRIRKYDIEMAWFPRPLLSEIANATDLDLPLKKLFIGGGSAESIELLQQRFGINVANAYGMTEIGPGLVVPDEISDPDVLGTCGLMSPFRECKVAREDGTEAEANEAGELWIKGDGIFNGYYNKPEANKESFVDGWFRTGDKFVRSEKGYFTIIGRFKDMIRRSSENISAMEVEHILSLHPQVRQAAVVPVPDNYRGEEVKAYVLLREGETPTSIAPEQLIDHCEARLAPFKIPRYIEYVAELPYTPTQKVAKHKLIAMKSDLTFDCWDRLANN